MGLVSEETSGPDDPRKKEQRAERGCVTSPPPGPCVQDHVIRKRGGSKSAFPIADTALLRRNHLLFRGATFFNGVSFGVFELRVVF